MQAKPAGRNGPLGFDGANGNPDHSRQTVE
jgi:hypothetical protein